eukprot:SAG22_NODE_1069_length_5726_cov_20.690954_7_plen_175_part_00
MEARQKGPCLGWLVAHQHASIWSSRCACGSSAVAPKPPTLRRMPTIERLQPACGEIWTGQAGIALTFGCTKSTSTASSVPSGSGGRWAPLAGGQLRNRKQRQLFRDSTGGSGSASKGSGVDTARAAVGARQTQTRPERKARWARCYAPAGGRQRADGRELPEGSRNHMERHCLR